MAAASLDGRVVIVTGAGREIGRNHTLELVAAGASVVVNEPAGPLWNADGRASLEETIARVGDLGGEVLATTFDVATEEGARDLWVAALERFGAVHCLVNAAGETRDRTLANMSLQEWDACVATCLRSVFCTSSVAARYWRGLAKAGTPLKSAIVNRSSTSAMPGQPGQVNYAAAMSGVATFSIVASREGAQYGMRVNCLCGPMDAAALRRASKIADAEGKPGAGTDWRVDAKVLSPVMAALLHEDCATTGQVLFVGPDQLKVLDAWAPLSEIAHPQDWSRAEIPGYLSELKMRRNNW